MVYEPKPLNTCDGSRWTAEGQTEDKSLSVRITGHCDNSCNFCIAEEDMKIREAYDLEALVKTTLDTESKIVSLIGGEPFLFLQKCNDYLNRVRDNVDAVWVTTSLPKTLITQEELFLEVMEKVDYLIVSLQSLDADMNNELLEAKQRFDRIELLAKLLKLFPEKITVNLNLVKGGVDTKEKLIASLMLLKDMGCTKVRLNEIMGAPLQYVNFEKIMGVTMESPYAHGCKTLIPFSDNMEVFLKRACFMVEDSLMATEDDVVKMQHKLDNPELYVREWSVMYEGGTQKNDWQAGRKRLPLTVIRG